MQHLFNQLTSYLNNISTIRIQKTARPTLLVGRPLRVRFTLEMALVYFLNTVLYKTKGELKRKKKKKSQNVMLAYQI